MHQIDFRAMGCHMFAIVDSNETRIQDTLKLVPSWFEEWENVLSRFRADSELNRLNVSEGRPFHTSEILFQVLEQSIIAAHNSNGLVTPTVLDALELAGYDRSFDSMNANIDRQQLSAVRRLPSLKSQTTNSAMGWRDIELDASTHTVKLPRGMRLDFGGTAKGWAADQAAQRLSQVAPALVDAGGDIAIGGAHANGDRWQVAIADPFTPDQDIEQLVIRAGGIATSGRDYRHWQKNGVTQHHIIDPRTGRPAETDVWSASVIAPNTIQAEVAAKVAFILGSQAGLRWIEEQPELACMLVLEDKRVIQSARFDEYVWRQVFIAGTNIFEQNETE